MCEKFEIKNDETKDNKKKNKIFSKMFLLYMLTFLISFIYLSVFMKFYIIRSMIHHDELTLNFFEIVAKSWNLSELILFFGLLYITYCLTQGVKSATYSMGENIGNVKKVPSWKKFYILVLCFFYFLLISILMYQQYLYHNTMEIVNLLNETLIKMKEYSFYVISGTVSLFGGETIGKSLTSVKR